MNSLPWIIAGIVLGVITIAVGAIILRKKRKEGETRVVNYRALFILGITFIPLGIVDEIVYFVSGTQVFLIIGTVFIVMGLLYLVIGLANKDKWIGKK